MIKTTNKKRNHYLIKGKPFNASLVKTSHYHISQTKAEETKNKTVKDTIVFSKHWKESLCIPSQILNCIPFFLTLFSSAFSSPQPYLSYYQSHPGHISTNNTTIFITRHNVSPCCWFRGLVG